MKKLTLYLSVFLLLLFSCETEFKKKSIEKNTYDIISLLFNNLMKVESINYPPPPPGENKVVSRKDSIRIDSLNKIIFKKRENKKRLIAIRPNFKAFSKKNKFKKCTGIKEIIKNSNIHNFESHLKKIELKKINKKDGDSLIYFKESLLEKNSKDFYKFQRLLEFSEIIFNKNYTKSIIEVTNYESELAGASMIYYLEKKEGNWAIVCEEGLMIF